MAHSNFSIQARPTPYLYFRAQTGESIQVASMGLATEGDAEDLQYMRSADFSELADNAQFGSALAAARRYADERGLVIAEEVVYFD